MLKRNYDKSYKVSTWDTSSATDKANLHMVHRD